uniref:Protein YIPF n=1 Tax=Riptortus pedestris TaxID=329032 RepID=R4WDP1_RIPPE|nr:conserved hypothetical protein [Riptortus pedestris]
MNDIYDDVLIPRDASVLLEFQEPHQIGASTGPPPSYPNAHSTNSSYEPEDNQKPKSASIFSLSYYQEFFNVNTEEVVKRVKCSLIPNMKVNYFEEYIKNKPDLYGPLWICITLAFTIAMGSNLLDYITTEPQNLPHWKYEFHIITKASLVVFVYVWIIPVILWSFIKWYLASQMYVSAFELICVYGYCLVVYIPLSLFWIVHINYLQWILLVLAVSSSGLVLVSTVQPMLTNKNYSIVGGVILLHVFFSIVIFLSFFHVK